MKKIILVLFSISISCNAVSIGFGETFDIVAYQDTPIWRLNEDKGSVSVCIMDFNEKKPYCSPWSQHYKSGTYKLSSTKTESVWVIDTSNGKVMRCSYSFGRGIIDKAPDCSSWSA